jgi:hypothetical protein
MNRNIKKTSSAETPEDHFEALGQLLTQLKAHLTSSAGKPGTYSDYLRLLEFYRSTSDERPREIIVQWVEPQRIDAEEMANEPAA